jgi:hypothetical protein
VGGEPDLAAMPTLDAERMRRDVEALAAMGPRFAGTEGEARARDWLGGELREAGLEVSLEEFTHLAYEPGGASCSAPGAELPCVGLQATASGVVEAEAVYVGDGIDFEVGEVPAASAPGLAPVGADAAGTRADPVDGRIAVFRSGVPTTVAPALVARGAVGLVCLSPAPDGLITHLVASFVPMVGPSEDERVLPVPGVTVEAAAGERLLARMTEGPTRLRIEHRASYVERTSANLVVEIPGTDPGSPRVVVGAHYDTQVDSPGAADNGTGLAALLAMARAWSGSRPRRTIDLVAFGVEETGSWGAADYVRRHAGDGIAAMVNLDALGPPLDATRTIVASPEIAALAAERSRSIGWEVEVELNAVDFPFADHAPFVAAGIPSAWIWRYPPPHPYYHSPGDTPRWVNFTLLAEDAAASAATTWHLANRP